MLDTTNLLLARLGAAFAAELKPKQKLKTVC
jgi:hypothetical protein